MDIPSKDVLIATYGQNYADAALDAYNSPFYEFLVDNYGGQSNVEIKLDTDTGKLGYIAINQENGSWFASPVDLSNIDTAVNGIPGMISNSVSNKGTTNFKTYIEYLSQGNFPDYMVIGSGKMYDDNHPDNSNLMMRTLDAAQENGANITDFGIVPFSWSGRSSMLNAGQVLAKYPDMNVRIATIDVSLMNSFNQYATQYIKNGQADAYNSELTSLFNHLDNVEMTMIIPDGDRSKWGDVTGLHDKEAGEITQLQNMGFDAVMVLSSRNVHGDIKEIAIRGGNVFDFAAGKISLKQFLANSEIAGVEVVPNSDERFYITDESILDRRTGRILSYKKRTIDSSSDFVNLTKINDAVKLQGQLISSNYEVVVDCMNALRSQIKANNYFDRNVQMFENSNGIPGCIAGYINAYYNMVATLMNKIEEESKKIICLAQKYVDLDNQITRDSYDFLFTQIDELPQESSTQMTEQFVNQPEDYSTSQPKIDSHTTYIPISESNDSYDNTQDSGNALKIIENDDNSRIVFNGNNDIIYEIPMLANDDYNKKINELEEKYKDLLYFDKIAFEDNTIKVIFRHEYFIGMNYDEIKKTILNGDVNNASVI